jgi:hypothetical protein
MAWLHHIGLDITALEVEHEQQIGTGYQQLQLYLENPTVMHVQ